MSALTKLFVVLLVITSLLLSAATVVFVNKVDDFAKINAAEVAKRNAADAMREKAMTELEAERTAKAQIVAQLNNERSSAVTLSQSHDSAIAERDTQIADLKKNNAILQAQISNLSNGNDSFAALAKTLQGQLEESRQAADKLTGEKADLNATVADLTNKLEMATKELRWQTELVQQRDVELDKVNKVLRENNLDASVPSIITRPEQPIAGVIRQVENIAGNTYATISVGSADSVVKGMQFKVIDLDRSEFLGTLTVEVVEPNEATGLLQGPGVSKVRNGIQVRTQL